MCYGIAQQHGSGGHILDLNPDRGGRRSSGMRATKDMDCLSGLYPGRRVSRKDMMVEEDGHLSSSSSSSESGGDHDNDKDDEDEDEDMNENVAYDKGGNELQEYGEEGENGLAAGSFSLDPNMVITQIVVFSPPDIVVVIVTLTL